MIQAEVNLREARMPPPRRFDAMAAWVMWRRELQRYRRDRGQWFGGVSRTLLWLVVMGYGLGAAFRDIEGYSYVQYILPGVITLNVLFAATQTSIALVWDREVGLLREVLVSPAPVSSIALGKLLGGATIAVSQGTIPLLLAPLTGIDLSIAAVLLSWAIMFSMGMLLTAVGIVIATRMNTFEGFGSISNGVIMPLYFLSGAVFPLKGIVGGVGFLELPESVRSQLRDLGIYALGGGWVVQLPSWLKALVFANPVSYQLDLLRSVLLSYQQLPITADLVITIALPVLAAVAAGVAMGRRRAAA